MAKPLSVVRGAAAADALIKAQAAPVPAAAPVEGVDMSDDAGAGAGGAPAPGLTLVPPQPQPLPFAPAPAVDDAGGDADASGTDFEHRFRVLEGKYKAETRRLRDDLTTAQARLDQSTAMFTALNEQKAREPAPAPVVAPVVSPLAKAELDEFGEDMLDASARFTLARVMPSIDAMRVEIATLRELVGKTDATARNTASTIALSAREQMFAALDQNVKTWRTVNEQPGFLNWLADEDGFSGETRHSLLTRAFERNDTARVQRFFSAYLSESTSGGESAKGGATVPNPPTAPSVASPSALVAPGRGRAAPVTSAPLAMEWTPALIRAFYDDVRNGRFRDDPDERARLEADIFAAQREGRVLAA